MTPQEVYREIERDKSSMAYWRLGTFKSLEKRARQMMKFPQTVWYDHETKRHNRYLFMSIIFDRNFHKNGISIGVALQKMERGWAVYYFGWQWQVKFNKLALLPHVFDRYADPERGNVQKTGIDLIKHFISRNTDGVAINGDKFSGRSVRYKGRDNLCLSMHDGVLLGEKVGDIFVAHTFITYDMATGLQSETFEKKRGTLRPQKVQSREKMPVKDDVLDAYYENK